jgi:hypothetical protein
VTDEPDGLRITIPARRYWYVIVFLALWSVGWFFAEKAALFQVFDPETAPPGKAFLTLWLLLWTAAGAFVIYTWLWLVSGREVLLFDATSLTVSRETALFARARTFDAHSVEDLRAAPTTAPWSLTDMRSSFAVWGLTGGHITFDYGAKTYHFGAGVDEAEAKQIVKQIVERYPGLALDNA